MQRPTDYTALFDASVLFPSFISNLLLWLAHTQLFRVKWSAHIHEEWIEKRLVRYPDLTREALERRRSRMDLEFPGSLVTDFEDLIVGLSLPDPADRHVLAAAIKSGSHVIVTSNLRDFPESALSPFGITAQHPDEFILDQIDLHPDSSHLVALAIAQHKRSLTSSKPTWKQYFAFMAKPAILPLTHRMCTSPDFKLCLASTLRALVHSEP